VLYQQKTLSTQTNHGAVYLPHLLSCISFYFTDYDSECFGSITNCQFVSVQSRQAAMLWMVSVWGCNSGVLVVLQKLNWGIWFEFLVFFNNKKKVAKEFQHLPRISCLPPASK